ncbi:hypothetical protein HMPREF2955_01685 [Prevotella sp. HMSC073D09]|nr:hypothetical protein HMPREF2955_01685 [Prevotella sp. HMSC073D09]
MPTIFFVQVRQTSHILIMELFIKHQIFCGDIILNTKDIKILYKKLTCFIFFAISQCMEVTYL